MDPTRLELVTLVVGGVLVTAAGLLILVEVYRFARCRVFRWCPHHATPGRIEDALGPLAAGYALADVERRERYGKPLSDPQRAAHLRCVLGRMRAAVEQYLATINGSKP